MATEIPESLHRELDIRKRLSACSFQGTSLKTG